MREGVRHILQRSCQVFRHVGVVYDTEGEFFAPINGKDKQEEMT